MAQLPSNVTFLIGRAPGRSPHASMDQIHSKLVQQRLLEIAEKEIGTKNFSLDITPGSEKGDNYIGLIYRANIYRKCDCNGADNCKYPECKKVNLIVKIPPESEARREQFQVRNVFLREITLYNEILPMFMKFQESKGIIPSEGGFNHYAPFYDAMTESHHEAIFMRDLAADGFKMFNRHNTLPPDHVLLVMRILGRLHAFSFAMKDQCPEKIEPYKSLNDLLTQIEDKKLGGFMTSMKDRSIETLDPDQHKDYIDKLRETFEQESVIDMIKRITSPEYAGSYAVITHGDCWNNNFLYKYNGDGKVEEARLLDWQISRYCSPVLDLMYYLFAGTSLQTRKLHYKEFIDTYYDSLSSFLERLGTDPHKVFPRSALDEQLKKCGIFGFLMAVMLIPIVTAHAENIPDLDEMAKNMGTDDDLIDIDAFVNGKSQNAYEERMKGVILDMFEQGYI